MAQDAKVDVNYDMVRETDREIREAIDNAGKPAEAAKTPEIRNPTPDNDPMACSSTWIFPSPPNRCCINASGRRPASSAGARSRSRSRARDAESALRLNFVARPNPAFLRRT